MAKRNKSIIYFPCRQYERVNLTIIQRCVALYVISFSKKRGSDLEINYFIVKKRWVLLDIFYNDVTFIN